MRVSLAVLLAILASAAPASAATYVVTNPMDDGAGTLRAAVEAAEERK